MSANFDMVIIGGGIAGASLGTELAAAGRQVAILEAEERCGLHSTGRSAAFYLESYGGPQVAPLTVASEKFLLDGGFLRRRGAVHLAQGEWPTVPEGVESRRMGRGELEAVVPGLRSKWDRGLFEPNCADIDVARLHDAYLAAFRRAGGTIFTKSEVIGAERTGDGWNIETASGDALDGAILINCAGAWADRVAELCGVRPIGLQPKRRTMVQLRVGARGLKDLPLIADSCGTFYFKGEGDRSVWLSPHDESDCEPCDAAPEEIDIATAIDRFEGVVDWRVERVERSWAGLRTFAPDRLPVYGFDSEEPAFFWCAGQGGFGIQTAPAAARLAAKLILDGGGDSPFSPRRFG